MNENGRFAPVELLEDRRVGGIPEPSVVIARQKPHAVGAEHVQRTRNLTQAPFGIGQRYGGEKAKAPRLFLFELVRIFVEAARGIASGCDVAKPQAGRA